MDFYADPAKAAKLLREKNELEPVVETYRAYLAALQEMQDSLELMADPDMKDFCQETYQNAKTRSEDLHRQLQILLLPKDPNDEKNVIVEIRGGVGGEESALFAHSLFRMYSMYAAAKGWKVELMNYNETELGGVKEADFVISGAGAYSRMKYESGVHRVQRVPETESGGRVHTSSALDGAPSFCRARHISRKARPRRRSEKRSPRGNRTRRSSPARRRAYRRQNY